MKRIACAVVLFCVVELSGICATFTNPVLDGGADPWAIFKDGYYYLTYTTGSNVQIRAATRLTGTNGIGRAGTRAVFNPPGPFNQNVWAPELHFLGDKAYIYYAADNGLNANHRMFVAESVKPGPAFSFAFKGKIYDPKADRWAIDGTVLDADDGSLYLIWSGWPGTQDGLQNLYIAPMSDPLTISGPRVLLSTPKLSWESWINEGPEILKRNGAVFIIFAANQSWTDNECLGALVNHDGNYLNPASWTKLTKPVFATSTNALGVVYGPGHCSFTKSLDMTEDWIFYHAARRKGSGWDRTIRMQPFIWTEDNLPDFGAPIPTTVAVSIPSGDAFTPPRINQIRLPNDSSVQIDSTAPLPLQTNAWLLEASRDLESWNALTNFSGLQYSGAAIEDRTPDRQFFRIRSER